MKKFNKNPIRGAKKLIRWTSIYLDTGIIRPHFDGKRELFIMISSFSRGGAQRVASVLASELSDFYHVTCITTKDVDNAYALDERVELIRIPWEKLGPDRTRRLVILLKKIRRPVASISFMFDSNEINLWGKCSCKAILSERNNPAKKMPERFPETVRQYRQADHVIFQSEIVRDLYDEDIRRHSTILPNPVSVTCYASPQTRHRIVTMGRLHPQKNQAMLIRAFAEFHKDHPDYTLSIYGEGELEQDLRALACDLGIGEAVLFHGNIDNIHPEIADAEMFVLSSDYEGLSNALLEAMMMGIPCISTSCEGSADVIRPGENGILVPVRDGQALADAMRILADDEELRKSIGLNGRKTGEGFRKEAVAEKWLEMIRKVSSGNKRKFRLQQKNH